jgi:hypothetical protein
VADAALLLLSLFRVELDEVVEMSLGGSSVLVLK